jgi:hypothetical protein
MRGSSFSKHDVQAMLSDFTLPQLTRWHRSKLLEHAQTVLLMQQQMITPRGKNIIHYTLKKQRKHIQLAHYPKGDRIDRATGAQYFYHCHREDFEQEEHGHFHCFIRQNKISKRIRPTPLHDWDKYQKNPLTHLVAVSMDRLGKPIRLFTTNRWVTSETWHDGTHAPRLLKQFKMTKTDDPYWQTLDHWLASLLQLFSPQIHWLHQKRDIAIAEHQANCPQDYVYENRSIEELSSIAIDLNTQIQWLL